MSRTPQYFNASTLDVAMNALENKQLRYPAVCFIEEGQYFSWLTKENKLIQICGYNQITDVEYKDNVLFFKNGAKILWSVDLNIDQIVFENLKEEIIKSIHLESYAKTEDVILLIEGKIGDLGHYENVIQYIQDYSYNNLKNKPIYNLYGSPAKAVVLSECNNGVYCVSGEYVIGGDFVTIHSGGAESLFVVEHIDNTSIVTKISGNEIIKYTIDSDYHCTPDQYITESWVHAQDFMTSDEVYAYVEELVNQMVDKAISEQLDTKLDAALDKKLGAINSDDINTLF